MIIEKWIAEPSGNGSPYTPPEMKTFVLRGLVFGHHHFKDGDAIVTSDITAVVDGKIKTVSGSIYELGEPHKFYEAAFPGAKERLLAAISCRQQNKGV